MALCPSNTDCLDLIFQMLDQVMKLHPDVSEFHIGCDEVFHLGLCDKCMARMSQDSIGKDQLFFDHIKKVASYLRNKYPQLKTIIVWDDMFRCSHSSVVLASGLGGIVEPMVWNYQPQLQLAPGLWDNLACVFPSVWIASAFKGATGPSTMVTNINFHLDNHQAWSHLLISIRSKFKIVRGIALTGWQRYDHYAVLCELFPQGLPSLAVCLKFIQKDGSWERQREIAEVGKWELFVSNHDSRHCSQRLLVCLGPLAWQGLVGEGYYGWTEDSSSTWIPVCTFPGSDVYQLTIEFSHLHRACTELFNGDGISAWMNDFNVQRRFINPVHVETLYTRAESLMEHCRSLASRLEPAFVDVFVSGVTEEWRECFLTPLLSRLEQFLNKARTFVGD
ncbi:hexosaminidase D-like [Elysia marginata]|uniref:beta-N-acetylhexosaminidase n=1 Tax=Elysia marginata TaxID=1093978 RepID=A0AAV4JEP2_9GAST|nr:hexosaminidase D-like [Elysia marginata]